MEGLSSILNKLSVEDVEKLKILFSVNQGSSDVKDAVTLRVFCEEYKSFIKANRSHSYYKSVVISLNHLTEYFGLQKPIHSLTHRDAESFITHLQQNVKKGYRVYYRNLKAAFNKALDWSYIDENYFTKVKLSKKQKVHPVFITEDELHRIVDKINVEIVKDVSVFGFYTGMRLNEIVNLKWKNISFDRNVIIVGDEDFSTKGRNQRFIPICEEVRTVLEKRRTGEGENVQLRRETPDVRQCPSPRPSPEGRGSLNCMMHIKDDYVFRKARGVKYTGDYFSRRFKQACRAANIDESVHFHTLRHSFASNLAQKGVSLYVIKELLGHTSISTTEIYSHLNIDSLREAVNKLDKPPLNLPLGKRETSSDGLRLVSGGS